MSRETSEWLNTNVLVGFTDQRGRAWHYRAGADNHYPGAIPVAEVERRLFDWEPAEQLIPCPCECGETFKAVMRDDNSHVMGMFRESYEPHSYREWLLNTVSAILGDTMQVGSAGLLRKGALAWVSVEAPENLSTPEGVVYRPHLLATTSFDGSTATTFKKVVTRVVCDNTCDAALRESGEEYKVRHTRNSGFRLPDARETLGLVENIADEFAAEVAELCAQTVTDRQWSQFLDTYVPAERDGSKRAWTMAERKRDDLAHLYYNDPRCEPWQGTAFGVVQTVDTYNQHEAPERGAIRAERNMIRVIKGDTVRADRAAYELLQTICA